MSSPLLERLLHLYLSAASVTVKEEYRSGWATD